MKQVSIYFVIALAFNSIAGAQAHETQDWEVEHRNEFGWSARLLEGRKCRVVERESGVVGPALSEIEVKATDCANCQETAPLFLYYNKNAGRQARVNFAGRTDGRIELFFSVWNGATEIAQTAVANKSADQLLNGIRVTLPILPTVSFECE